MEVILREDIEKLGSRGETVKVASGYARNFLLPKRLAVVANESNKRSSSRSVMRTCARKPSWWDEAQDLSKLLTGVSVNHRAEGRRSRPVVRLGDLEGHRRSAGGAELHHRPAEDSARGTHQATRRVQVPVKLHKDVTAEITVVVVKEEEG